MTRQNRNLLLQFAVATAACGAIGLVGQPLIGLIGVVLCVVIFTLHAVSLTMQKSVSGSSAATDGFPSAPRDESLIATSERVPGCYNADNPVLPVYYPTDRRD